MSRNPQRNIDSGITLPVKRLIYRFEKIETYENKNNLLCPANYFVYILCKGINA